LKKLLKYFKNYRKEAICAPVFKIIEAIFELLVPLVVAKIIDVGIPSGNKGYIVGMCGIMILFGAIGLASTLTAQYFSAKGAVGFSSTIRQALFDHIQSLSFTELDRLGTSTLITRLTNDINQVQTGVNLTLRLLMRSPIIVFGAMIMAFTIDVKSALIFVGVIPALSVVVFGIMLVSIPLYAKVQARLDKVLLKTKENLAGARVIRAFCMEESETADFVEKNESLAKIQKFVGKISSVMNPMTYVIVNLGIIFLLYRGAVEVDNGRLTQGMVIALYNYMSQILVELVKLANLIISITKSVACGNRIQAVLDIEPSMEDGSILSGDKSSEYAVEMEGVSFKYASASADSIEDINLKIKKGETLGVIGSTGCGKTTLISLIPRFYDCTAGTVKVNGVDVKDYTQETLREKVAVVMQKTVLFNGSIRDNIRWGNENATDEEISRAVSSAQAADVVASKPEGLDFIVEQGGKNLSGGQQQRLSIARALVRKPEILILDNSSSALDYATEAALRKSISELDFKPTVITVSQRVSAVMHSDRIMVLEDGRAVGLGTHEELLESCPEYKELYESQIKSSKGGASA
jgi:ATP-binding cassette subfamily B multidrug efflux pump